MKHTSQSVRGRSHRLLPRIALGGLLLATPLLAGCDLDELLDVDDPFTVTPEVARDTANLENVFAGARARFARAFGGEQNTEGGVVIHSGLMADELYSSDNFTSRWELDTRDINYNGLTAASDFTFQYLQRARAEALAGAELFSQTSRAGTARHAELYSLAGYSVLMLAENFCSGVPLSRFDPQEGLIYGAPLSTEDLYQQSIVYFDSAAALAASNERQLNLARVGKARALLDLGRFAEAAQVAAQVPDNFAFLVEYDAATDDAQNAVNQMINDEKRFSASLREGTINQGLPFGLEIDGRTPIADTPVRGNAGVETFLQLKYEDKGSDIPLATTFEARYIQAEAALQANQVAQFEDLLNQARRLQGLEPLTSAEIGTTAAERIDTLFRERAYAMWLTGHRLSDLRRLIRQYNRTEDEVFPTGQTPYGLTYGNDVSMPVPFEETNNPLYTGCTDTGA